MAKLDSKPQGRCDRAGYRSSKSVYLVGARASRFAVRGRKGLVEDFDIAPYSGQCPKCLLVRVMSGSTKRQLLFLLKTGGEIGGYCGPCDSRWALIPHERSAIAKGLR